MRSLLYVPADNDRFIARAHERGADCIILDLEDAVPDAAKPGARSRLADSVSRIRRGPSRVAVRINAGNADDIRAALAAGVDFIVAPKIAAPDDVITLDGQLGAGETAVIATIESPAGILAAAAIATHPRLVALVTGSEDLALAMGAVPEPDVLRFPKLMVHYAAKAAGKLSLGLMRSIADYGDVDAIAEAARESRRHGFDGATCVHPSAVPVLNACFRPAPEEIAWARGVLATRGTVGLDGRMIDRPVLERARAILVAAGES